MNTATVKKLHPSKYELAKPCVNQLVTNVVPVNQPPILRYAVGNSKSPDHPIKVNLSLFNQSSNSVTAPAKYPLLYTYVVEYIKVIVVSILMLVEAINLLYIILHSVPYVYAIEPFSTPPTKNTATTPNAK